MQDHLDGFRGFVSFRDWPTAQRELGGLQGDEKQHINEIIRHRLPCKPYLDVDGEGVLPAEYTQESALELFGDTVLATFREDFVVNLPPAALVWEISENPSKFSVHLVVSSHAPQYVFHSNHFEDPQGAYQLAIRVGHWLWRRLIELVSSR